MATTKKTTKKAAPRSTSVTSSAKKAPVLNKVSKKKTAVKSKSKPAQMRSFRVSPNQPSFKTFRITRQTVYWIILIAFIMFAQLWILQLQLEVATLLDAQQAQLQSM